ncbi:universal stress protein [Streptomyces zingiberis]|uniref:Universal stress protein n=1 Tax=Streptomyces zingiberis TaxID=2053010 RepID=A0ABX1BXJ0_9ACTN|nr:universal stress protein [Streptomyces zingiberis]NJQ00207.1 universal stress protein [Streptomyces zingiberis]
MPRPVVAGIDGTRAGSAAADWAAREALRRELPLTLVHAWSWEPLDLPVTQDTEAQREAAGRLLHEAAGALRERHPRLELTAEQPPAPAVTALLARSEDAEMLVLGTRGHGRLMGFLLGSVGLQVLGRAASPVVMVRPAQDGSDRPAPPGRSEVVVGLENLTATGEPVLAFAFAHAAANGMRIHAVRAWALPTVFNYSPAAMELADEAGGIEAHEKQQLHTALRPWRERYPQVEVVEQVEIGAAAEVLLTASGRAGLVVVGRRRRPGRGHLGPVAHATLHHACCPVAVVSHD